MGYIKLETARQVLNSLARSPRYQHAGEDYYVGIAEAIDALLDVPEEAVEPVKSYRAPKEDWVRQYGTCKMAYEFLRGCDIDLGEVGNSINIEINKETKILRITLFKDDRYQDQITVDLMDEFGG